jgi:hypothetical protein
MFSISHALAAADAANATIENSVKRGELASTPNEIAESRIEKAKVSIHYQSVFATKRITQALQALDQAVNVVESSLQKLRDNISVKHGAPKAYKSPLSKRKTKSVLAPAPAPAPVPAILNGHLKVSGLKSLAATAAPSDDKVKKLIKTMSAVKGDSSNPTLANTVPTLNDMANKIGPIIDNFDEVLVSFC